VIFVDTGFLVALFNKRDRDHQTSHERAIYVGERLYSGKLARIHQASFEEQMAAFEYLKRHRDKTYSAVDCLSFVVMEKHGIAEALLRNSRSALRLTSP
jgi:predicted nucleic acid-binding protein